MIVALRSAVLHILLRVETVSLVIREEIRVPKKSPNCCTYLRCFDKCNTSFMPIKPNF